MLVAAESADLQQTFDGFKTKGHVVSNHIIQRPSHAIYPSMRLRVPLELTAANLPAAPAHPVAQSFLRGARYTRAPLRSTFSMHGASNPGHICPALQAAAGAQAEAVAGARVIAIEDADQDADSSVSCMHLHSHWRLHNMSVARPCDCLACMYANASPY